MQLLWEFQRLSLRSKNDNSTIKNSNPKHDKNSHKPSSSKYYILMRLKI